MEITYWECVASNTPFFIEKQVYRQEDDKLQYTKEKQKIFKVMDKTMISFSNVWKPVDCEPAIGYLYMTYKKGNMECIFQQVDKYNKPIINNQRMYEFGIKGFWRKRFGIFNLLEPVLDFWDKSTIIDTVTFQLIYKT